jgi:hypothetical protein
VVLSAFGVMFVPDQEKAAAELVRVCNPGGSIGLANWTPNGFVGELFQTIGRYVAPSPSIESSTLWGTEAASAGALCRKCDFNSLYEARIHPSLPYSQTVDRRFSQSLSSNEKDLRGAGSSAPDRAHQ